MPGLTIWGANPERRRREDRGAEGAEAETDNAIGVEGVENGEGVPLLSRVGGLEERRKLLQRGSGQDGRKRF